MDLEKLQQEAEALQKLDTSQMTPEQLSELFEKLTSILEQSEKSLTNTTFIESQTQNEDETSNS
jgi:hypothetical protein